jgi:Ferritin-like
MNTGARINSAIIAPEDSGEFARRQSHRQRARAKWAADHPKRPDMTWRDHLLMLLSFGATVEHCLMVQYLYAAYSLRIDEPDKDRRKMIERWRADIIAVAREEMGHLLTVQNLRLLLGSTVDIGRDSSPWAREYYPYPFTLEPVSLLSLSCFVYAEAPSFDASDTDFCEDDRAIVKNEVLPKLHEYFGSTFKSDVHRVGELYEEIIDLIADRSNIPDEMFDESSYEFQASWDEWGRGYKAPPRQLDAEGNPLGDNLKPEDDKKKSGNDKQKSGKDKKKLADDERDERQAAHDGIVQIDRMATRADALKALKALAAQGEAPHLRNPLLPDSKDEVSHFKRFLRIYQEFKDEQGKDPSWLPAAGIPANPITLTGFMAATASATGHGAESPAAGQPVAQLAGQGGGQPIVISGKSAGHLAQLFNQRYRLLLNYLAHSFRISRSERVDRPNLRAMIMHRVFGEMYNLKTISGLLVRLPRSDNGRDDERAAPPFELPYTLTLPDRDVDMWRRHENLLAASQKICMALLADADPSKSRNPNAAKYQHELACTGADAYLHTLLQLDTQARDWMNRIIAAEA